MNAKTDQRVVFLHVPKTGGTTLRSVIARQYQSGELYEIANPIDENLIAFRDADESTRHGVTAIQGHMSFGLHEYMRSPVTYITMLREPVGRAISDFAFVSSNTLHPLYEQVRKMTIVEYLESGLTGQLENGQTRLVCGDAASGDIGIPTLRKMTQADLDRAIEHLERDFSVVGLLARFDESLILMRDALGWSQPLYVRENVTDRKAKPSLTENDYAAIREFNALDLALYDYATQRFDREAAARGEDLAKELSRFQRANKRYALRQQATWTQLRPRLGRLKRRLTGQ